MSVQVWLAEKAYSGPSDILGVFSDPGKAKQACQDHADAYFGAGNTPELGWQDYEGHSNAPYQHPATGLASLFSVTRYEAHAQALGAEDLPDSERLLGYRLSALTG